METPDSHTWVSGAFAYPFGLYVVSADGTMARWALDDLTEASLAFAGSVSGTQWSAVAGFTEWLGCQHRDGTLWSWGAVDPRDEGCLTQVEAGPWREVSGDCRIATTGAMWCNSPGVGLVQIGVDTDWDTVSASWLGATCAIKTDRSLWCWGENRNGEVGDGTTEPRSSPVQIAGTTNWTDVATRNDHTCALASDGSLWCWGANGRGALGDGTFASRSTPGRVGRAAWMSILDAYCAVDRAWELSCWGDEWGNAPTRVSSGDDMTQLVHDGGNMLCGIKRDATLWCATLRIDARF